LHHDVGNFNASKLRKSQMTKENEADQQKKGRKSNSKSNQINKQTKQMRVSKG